MARSQRTAATRRKKTYDLVIIGAGPGGLAAAEFAARLGARVALLERERLGGVSLNTGSVPSKSLIRSATLFAAMREAARLQQPAQAEPVADLQRVIARLRRMQRRIGGYHSEARLKRAGIELHYGAARFVDERLIATNMGRFPFHHALVATGAGPTRPQIPGLIEGSYLTSDTIFGLEKLPEHLAVVGGGALGCELAQSFCRLGSRVTIIQDEAGFLPGEERDAAQVLAQSMARDGVTIRLNTSVTGARVGKAEVVLRTQNYGRTAEVQADRVLVSIGRTPCTDGLSLESAGVRADTATGIAVDEFLRTSNPRVYAAGDVCLRHRYANVAERTARIAVHNCLAKGRPMRHTALTIPWCTFCAPEIAHVGLQVWQARNEGIPIRTFTVMMQDIDRAILDRQDVGFVKLHSTGRNDKIVGATIVASRASEMINEVCVAMSTGIGLRELADVLHIYPSQSDAIRIAAMDLDEPLAPG
ncbi:MAG: FAD-dependent oxidoreductase [Proteobacteria bacterium]|nr:FAD-dependent oxidoreductase [Pseudomonadota bacterium]